MGIPIVLASSVDALLHRAVDDHAFPGAVALVANRSGVVYRAAVGAHTYAADAPPMSAEGTLFDLASLTKVVATTTSTMLLYQSGELSLDTLLVDLFGARFAAADARKANMTVQHLLLHAAGWPPDPTPCFCTPAFACPETSRAPAANRSLAFSCQAQVLEALHAQTLQRRPVESGALAAPRLL